MPAGADDQTTPTPEEPVAANPPTEEATPPAELAAAAPAPETPVVAATAPPADKPVTDTPAEPVAPAPEETATAVEPPPPAPEERPLAGLPENVETVEAPSAAPVAWQQSSLGNQSGKVSPPPKGHARYTKLFILMVLVLLLILGGSAFAYYGYYLPNQPDNKLEQAFANLAQQQQVSVNGSVDIASTSKQSKTPGISINFKTDTDLQQTELATSGTVGVSGTQFPFELRYVNKNIYFKIGGLSELAKVVPKSTSPLVNLYVQVLKNVDSQWYVIDHSFIDNLGSSANCTTNLSFTLTDSDINLLKKAYTNDPLFTVISTTPATVDSVPTTKMKLDPASDATVKAFAAQLNNLSIVQNIRKCFNNSSNSSQTNHAVNLPNQTTAGETIYAYVSADKQLKKLELDSNANGTMDTMALTFSPQIGSITAPSGAKPIQNILGGLSNPSGLSN